MVNEQGNATDFRNRPFGQMVVFCFKWTLAALPSLAFLLVLWFFFVFAFFAIQSPTQFQLMEANQPSPAE